jgi:two-component system sensor histidine kinase DesK
LAPSSPVRSGEPDARPASPEWQPGGGLLIWLLLLIAPAAEAIASRPGNWWWAVALLVAYGAGFAVVVYEFEHGVAERVRYPTLIAFVAAGLALTTMFNSTAVFVVVFTSMAVAISLPLLRPAFLGLLAVTACAMLIGIPGGVFAILGLGFGTYIAGFVTFVMRRLFVAIAELQQAREELATAAVAQERLRFARDLHDLLGHSLSVIVVKAEVIRRLAVTDPAAASAAAADIEAVGRRALDEVRDAVSGYRRAGLATEASRAESALHDAGIATTLHLPTSDLDPDTDAIFGWAVREASTNVLRHSRARHCSIAVDSGGDEMELVVADDGVGPPTTIAATNSPTDGTATTIRGGATGNGLLGLAERVSAAGGTLSAGPATGESPYGAEGFVLTVRIPARSGTQPWDARDRGGSAPARNRSASS